MLARPAQCAFRSARTPLSAWAQPSAHLHASAQRPLQQSRIAQSLRVQPSSLRHNGALYRQSISTLRSSRSPCRALGTPPISQSIRRPFSFTARSQYQYNQYNRFGGQQRRGSLFYTLIQHAKPHHFVIIGLGISGIYLYNTDVVAVRRTPIQMEHKPTKRTLT